jgi:spore coat polysaccharide biosynthesis protein SpsF (cytidylyltransferase family)
MCVGRVQQAMWVDEIIIAAPHPIPGYEVFVPTKVLENDVLSRYYQCAKVFKADVIVRITADCPFIDPDIIDEAIEYYFRTRHEYVCFAPIDGLDTEVFSFQLLKEAWKKAKDPYDREHVTPYMRRKSKLSIDTKSDLEKARRWYGLHQ